MSVRIMGAVWDAPLPPSQKLVLMSYADHADHEGRNIWPGVPLTARKTGYSQRQVQRTTQELLELGILIEDGHGRNNVRRYRIDLDALAAYSAPSGDTMSPPGSDTTSPPEPQGVTFATPRGDTMSPKPNTDPLTAVVVVDPDPTIPDLSFSQSKTRARAHATPHADLCAAFLDAHILGDAQTAIVTAWPDITPADIHAWHTYRTQHNDAHPRHAIGPGAIILHMTNRRRAPPALYHQAQLTADTYKPFVLE